MAPGPVTVSFTVEDNESAITSQTGCDTATVSVETAGDTFTCQATSSGGTASQTVTVKLDLAAPSFTCPADVTAEAGEPIALGVPSVADSVDADPLLSNNAPAAFPLGTTAVLWSAIDDAGNTGQCSQNVTVQDTTPPSLNVPADITVEATGPTGAAVTFSATAIDAVSGNVAVNCTPASGSTFPLGTTPVSCSAIDNAGNGANGSFSGTVRDTTPPALTCPAAVGVIQGQPVNLGTPTVSDLVDPSPAVSNNAPASFPVGTTATWTATDQSGNSASCAQPVTVRANSAPTTTADTFLFNPWTAPAAPVTRTVAAPGVLGNDTDADGDALTAVLVGPLPAGRGTLALNGDGSFQFTPNSGVTSANFTYGASDGAAQSATATVSLRRNQRPTTPADNCTYRRSTNAITAGTACTVLGSNVLQIRLLANDTDPNGSTNAPTDGIGKTVVVSSMQVTQLSPATAGSLVNNGDGTITVTLSPALTAGTKFTYSYTVDDDLGLRSAGRQNSVTVK